MTFMLSHPSNRSPIGMHAIALGANDCPQLAGFNMLLQPGYLFVEAPAMSNHEQRAGLSGGFEHGFGLASVHRYRLFDHHVHTGV